MQQPRFKYSIHIHPKPRGNWRPKVEISISIRAEDHPWRPRLEGLCIWGIGGQTRYSELIEAENCIFLPQIEGKENTIIHIKGKKPSIWIGDLAAKDSECAAIWKYFKKGDRKLVSYDTEEKLSYILLLRHSYLDEDISINDSFYLPWRLGARPDYSDFMARFRLIPQAIYNQLLDGLDSGESQELNMSGEANFANMFQPSPIEHETTKPARRVMVRRRG